MLVLSACGGSDAQSPESTRADASKHAEAQTETAPPEDPLPLAAPSQPQSEDPLPVAAPSHCPPGLQNCSTASGRIVYIEAVDPDGDGDAHFILLSADSVTAPGLSIIDISKDLRPKRLPVLGTSVSAAGPVYPGHLGQHQIQASELHIAHRGLSR